MFEAFKFEQEPNPPVTNKKRPEAFEFSEELLGAVHGKPASALEERYANALKKLQKANVIDGFNFAMNVPTPFQIPGQENEIDFFVWVANILYPVEVDGAFTHKTGEQRAHDMIRDAILNDVLRKRYPGAQPIHRIPGEYLETQAKADEYARSQF